MYFLINFLSGSLPFAFLMLTGIRLTVSTRFSQITHFFKSVKLTAAAFRSSRGSKEITSYKAACTALSATVGTGNIVGVAGAIALGGAGAVFWMWISGVLGMVIKASEIKLAVKYREKSDNGFAGGPMYYIKNGLGKGFLPLSVLFCLSAIPAAFCSGNITQTNAAILSFGTSNLQRLIWGIIFAVGCSLCIRGGFSGITNLTEKIVPLMSALYIILSLGVIITNCKSIPHCFYLIFKGAFNPKAVTGGAVGSAFTCMFLGASRGIFSNEAGLGTSAMAHSVAVDASCETQGLFGIFEVFIDTIILCTLTALTILCSGVKINYGYETSAGPVLEALNLTYGNFGNISLSVMMCLFAFSSIIGWAVYGKLCVEFIFGDKGYKIFLYLYPLSCILGAMVGVELAWLLAGLCNGIMLCINLTAVLLLNGKSEKIDRKKN